jgi:integrase
VAGYERFEEWYRYDDPEVHQGRRFLDQLLNSPENHDLSSVRSLLRGDRYDTCGLIGTADNTERAYLSDQRRYIAAAHRAGLHPLTPTPQFWTSYFEAYAVGRRHTTVQRHAFGIAQLFFAADLPPPTRFMTHKRLMRSIAKSDKRQTKKAKPLFGSELKKLIHSYGKKNIRDFRDLTITVIGGNRGFRASTIAGIQLEGISFDNAGVRISLYTEKGASNGEPIYSATPHCKTKTFCMPCTLRQYIAMMRAIGVTDGPAFRRINRWGQMHTSALTPKAITYILRRGLKSAGIDHAEQYSSHSFRHGVVATAVKKGWSEEEIMLVTLHRSRKGLRAYTQAVDPWHSQPKKPVLDGDSPSGPEPGAGWIHDRKS